MSKTLLVVDDDENVIKLLSLDIEQRGVNYHVRSAQSGNEAVSIIKTEEPDILILDLRMRNGDGFSVLEHLQSASKQIPVIVLTNYRNDEYIKKCTSFGVKEYIIKQETRMDRVVDTVIGHL